MKKRFTEEQIIDFLKEADARMPVTQLCRTHGFSDAKRLKALEDENNRLKRFLADVLLDNAALKDVASRKW